MTEEEVAELKVLISEATTAYHNLRTGQSVVKMRDQNGEEVTFNKAEKNDLYAYLQDLKTQLPGSPGLSQIAFKPIGYLF